MDDKTETTETTEPQTETTEQQADTTEPTPDPAVAELQRRLDELTVEKDKTIAKLEAEKNEMQRRYEIAVKTGSKTEPQAQPVENNPVAAWIEKNLT